ncbi:TspO/MBR family protein [Actinomadura livida]|nr:MULTISPECIES: TspO/MBR family protein [Actinomadura]MBB4771748.1 tryptophan-rich sensory protein [Actinomadura catellatispora]GGU02272.1 tryptophan-rich sensory protein [Actinomadura livida]
MGDRVKTYGATSAAVAVAAAVGGKAVDADSAWYRALAKPAWQPPGWTFGVVWTPLYASIAWASGRALLRSRGREQRALTASLGVNLALNAAWNVLFFRRRSTAAGVVGTVLLDVSNAELIRRTARADGAAGAALVPYAVWCLFATALNSDIAYRNRPARR